MINSQVKPKQEKQSYGNMLQSLRDFHLGTSTMNIEY